MKEVVGKDGQKDSTMEVDGGEATMDHKIWERTRVDIVRI
jgi:hypothetical protein